jgi:hypothetical protein
VRCLLPVGSVSGFGALTVTGFISVLLVLSRLSCHAVLTRLTQRPPHPHPALRQAYGSDNYSHSCGLFDKPCVMAYHTPWNGAPAFAEGLTSFLLSLQPYQYFATGDAWSGGGGGAADHNPWAPDLGAQACQTWLQRHPEYVVVVLSLEASLARGYYQPVNPNPNPNPKPNPKPKPNPNPNVHRYDRKLGPPLDPAASTNDTWPRHYLSANGSTWDRCATDAHEASLVWCALFARNLHSRMPLSFTPLLRLKRCYACDQWHSSRVSTFFSKIYREL